MTGHRWAVGAAIGVLTAGVALGTAELLAGLFGPGSSPIVAVGGAAVDASPEWLKSFAIRTFGEQDKLALLIGIGAVLTIAVSLLGAASVRRPGLGMVGCVVLGAIGAAAAVTRPANDLADAIPSIAGAFVGVVVYGRLREAAGLPGRTSGTPEPSLCPRRPSRATTAGGSCGGVRPPASPRSPEVSDDYSRVAPLPRRRERPRRSRTHGRRAAAPGRDRPRRDRRRTVPDAEP